MIFFGQIPKGQLVIWFSQITIVSVLWNFLPTQDTASLLIVLVFINAILLYKEQYDLPLLSSVILILSLAHFWQGSGFISPLVGSILIFIGVTSSGLVVNNLKHEYNQEAGLAWFLVGLFTSQFATFTQYWPITFFQKSALGIIVFYLIWQSWVGLKDEKGLSVNHFVFVLLTVIVLIVNIAWTTWPGLKNF